MFLVIIQALYFFLPSYIANAVPILLDKFKILESLKKPVDGGLIFGGEPLFGATKTIRGIVGGILAGMLIVTVQAGLYMLVPQMDFLYLIPYDSPNIIFLGFLLGFGEGLGDLIKSFFKRRLHVKSSGPAIPLDQSSFLMSLLFGYLYFPLSWPHIVAIILISPLFPILANLISYKVGWKKVWW